MAASDTSPLYDYDRGIQSAHGVVISGLDEAGRGPLAGPVVAAAVILDLSRPIQGINDSKKLSALRRDRLYDEITARSAAWAVGMATHDEIDRINILKASLLAMERALAQMSASWSMALVDGNQPLPTVDAKRQMTVIGGDAKSASIAAASILAKVTRDRIMLEYHRQYPEYGFDRHKGYPTQQHISAVRKTGVSAIHRKTFCSHFVDQTSLDI